MYYLEAAGRGSPFCPRLNILNLSPISEGLANVSAFSKKSLEAKRKRANNHRTCLVRNYVCFTRFRWSYIFLCSYVPLIIKPTRITAHLATLLDNIYLRMWHHCTMIQKWLNYQRSIRSFSYIFRNCNRPPLTKIQAPYYC